ncbi:MAG: FAD-binding oxidoreductase [Candidatus Brocadiales bacterium]
MMKIEEVIQESTLARTLIFNKRLEYQPGQFVMLWIPRLDEKPFSVSYHDKDSFGITVALKGRFTQRLHEMKVGEWVGIRGPFGTSFNINGGKACVVGGGVGMAHLLHVVG